MTHDTPMLFTPYALRKARGRNRIVLSPMQMYVAENGFANDWHFQHLAKYAVGGWGIVFTEVLVVEPCGRNTHGDLGIWRDDHVPALRRIAGFLRAQGAVPAAQIGHCGPKAARQRPWEGLQALSATDAARGEPPWTPVGAVAEPSAPGYRVPHALAPDEIPPIVEAFGQAARRCDEAGFDVLEVHAAHGYLIHSFLSPINNTRRDSYGGDMAGRMRLAFEVAEAVRGRWPEPKALSFRLSCSDLVEGGWSIEDTCTLAGELRARGVDVIDCSAGGIRGANTLVNQQLRKRRMRPGFQVSLAARVRRAIGMPTVAVGLILYPEQAEQIIRRGQADLLAIAREALFNPHWPLQTAVKLGVDPEWQLWPPQYGWWLHQRELTGIDESAWQEEAEA